MLHALLFAMSGKPRVSFQVVKNNLGKKACIKFEYVSKPVYSTEIQQLNGTVYGNIKKSHYLGKYMHVSFNFCYNMFTICCLLATTIVAAVITTVEPRYKEAGYNKTLL